MGNDFEGYLGAIQSKRSGKSKNEKRVLGQADQMTPARAAQSLVRAAAHGKVVMVPGGHNMMAESPDPVLMAMKNFLGA